MCGIPRILLIFKLRGDEGELRTMQREEGTIFRDPDTRTPPDSANVGRNLKKSATKENIMNIIVSLSHQFYFNQHQSYL